MVRLPLSLGLLSLATSSVLAQQRGNNRFSENNDVSVPHRNNYISGCVDGKTCTTSGSQTGYTWCVGGVVYQFNCASGTVCYQKGMEIDCGFPSASSSTTTTTKKTTTTTKGSTKTTTATTKPTTSTTTATTTNQGTSTTTTATKPTTSTTTTVLATTTTTSNSALPTSPPLFNISNRYGKLVIGYWGQNAQFGETSLASYCDQNSYDVINLSFMMLWGRGQEPIVDLDKWNGRVPEVAQHIVYCQKKGILINLSVGGATGTSVLISDADAKDFANKVWNNYFGGNIGGMNRFFGPHVVLNGLDLDIENNNQLYYDTFAKSLRGLGFSKGKYYLTGAPQCPIPDYNLGTAMDNAGDQFDWIAPQFYNNYCAMNQQFNFLEWNEYAMKKGFKLAIGMPAATGAASNGYVPASTVISKYQSLRSNASVGNNLVGVMFWSCGWSDKTGFAKSLRSGL